jgi:predicted flap endonuclease-1-like 5' DNA nuclease
MPYTLAKGIAWVLLALLLGGVIGYLLRSVTARRQVARARAVSGVAEADRLRVRVAELEAALAGAAAAEAGAGGAAGCSAATAPAPTPAPPAVADAAPAGPPGGSDELARVAAVLGRPVLADDLTVVEGIGPQVAELCQGIGIATWSDLAATEVSLLRTMLDDAGSRFQVNDPSTWPEQAALLADGRWTEFVDLVESLRAERSP